MLADLAAWTIRFAPFAALAGMCFVLAGCIWIAVFRRTRPLPRKLAEPPAPHRPLLPPKSHAAREDSDTGVIPQVGGPVGKMPVIGETGCALVLPPRPGIPGATPQAAPVCPVCGGPWHAVCPSKERTEGVAESALVRIPPYAPTWPQFPPGLEPPTVVLRQVPGPSVDELDTLAARHRAPDDCPLTTDSIRIDIHAPTPLHDATKRGDTVDLGAKTQKIRAAAS